MGLNSHIYTLILNCSLTGRIPIKSQKSASSVNKYD